MSHPRLRLPASCTRIVALDPSTRASGVAVWDVASGRVLAAYTAHNPVRGADHAVELVLGFARPWGHATWVAERPVRYGNKSARDEGIDMIEDVLNGLRASGVRFAKTWTPSEWKGSIPKDVHHRRLAARLKDAVPAEPPSSWDHNTWDAIGVGAYALGLVSRGAV